MINRARFRRAPEPAIAPWEPSDGVDFVVARVDRTGIMFFVASPPGWSTSWRHASRFKTRAAAEAMIAPKAAGTPAGPAAERGAEVRQLGPWTTGLAA